MSNIVNVAQLSQKLPAFTQSSLRWLIFNSASNGLEKSGALMRLGRRVLIDEEKFIEWVRSSSGQRG
jgi:hypothetical protein